MSRQGFLFQKAPENYVAGLGRGATGFTTRSDLGPARGGPSKEDIEKALAARAEKLNGNADDERYQDAQDDEVGLFAGGIYDKDDDEADRIWQAVDERMAKRRKVHREAQEKQDQEDYDRNNPTISAQFADLKRGLSTMSYDDWASIPEVGDLTGKNRRTNQNIRQRYYAVPDSVLAGARDSTQLGTSIQDDAVAEDGRGREDGADGTMTNFAAIGAARQKALNVQLDQAASAEGFVKSGADATIDAKGYLTSLAGWESTARDITAGHAERTRFLLNSITKTNPKSAVAWIALARLEEAAGKIQRARKVMAQGCEECPKSEDAWLENIRLNETHNAKVIVANALKSKPRSMKLWIEAMNLETDARSKKKVIHMAILEIPGSVVLWKEAVNLEEDESNARLVLARAIEVIPQSVELRLALARLETPENAQKILNSARQAVPTSHEVWIAAARLQEQLGKDVSKIIKSAIKSLTNLSAMLKREEWILEAEKCEEEGAIGTCKAIIAETLGWSLDEDDYRCDTWKDDAAASISRGKHETARAIYAYALRVFPTVRSLWLTVADVERNHGDREALCALLEKGVQACPQSEALWLQLAREKWKGGEVNDARVVLAKAFDQNPNNEEIWLAAVKLEADANNVSQARELLATARREASTERLWYKSAAYERQLGNIDDALDLVLQGLSSTVVHGQETRFPRSAKLWMIKGQIYEDKGMIPQAREAYSNGTRSCPKSPALWLLAARLEQKAGVMIKARAVLDRARLQNPKNAQLWRESIRLERLEKKVPQATFLMAKALQECPGNGLLLSENIMHLIPRTQQRDQCLKAIKQNDSDPFLYLTAARIFWNERKIEKALKWLEAAVTADATQGDSWALLLKFLRQHGTEEKQNDVISRCVACEPKYGEVWQRIRKHPSNFSLSIEQVLQKAADEIE